MAEITFKSAQELYRQEKYEAAFEQFVHLADSKINPAFSSFLAGNALFNSSGNSEETWAWYTKALQFDDSNALINREVERFALAHNIVNPKQQTVLHYYPTTPNIGDSGSAAGIRSCINSLTDGLSFFTLSCRNDGIETIEKSGHNCSGIIIGGGGLYFQQPTPSGWYFPLTLSEVAMLKAPAVSFAVGFNRERSKNAAWDLNDAFIRKIAQYNNTFSLKSVRDTWSKRLLEKQGVTDLSLVPCPSMLLKPLVWYDLPVKDSPSLIGINLTERSVKIEGKKAFFSHVLKFADWLQEHGYTPLFIFQDCADDMGLAQMIADKGHAGILPHTAREAVTIYRQCDFVIGMRGHSLILAAGQCVPMLALSYNQKVDAFMDLLDMNEYCMDHEDIKSDHDLIFLFEKLVDNKDNLIAQ